MKSLIWADGLLYIYMGGGGVAHDIFLGGWHQIYPPPPDIFLSLHFDDTFLCGSPPISGCNV